MSIEKFLTIIPLFKSLGPEDTRRLAASVRSQSLKKGEVLFSKGSEGTALFVIRRGRIKIVLPSRVGDEVILAIFSEGDFLVKWPLWMVCHVLLMHWHLNHPRYMF